MRTLARTILFISASAFFAVLFSFHSSMLSIGGAKSPQDPDARPSTNRTSPVRKKKKATPATKTSPTNATTDFIGMTIDLNTSGNGTISGKATWAGPVKRLQIDTSADPLCTQMNAKLMSEEIAVNNGRLANVFVYVRDGMTADGQQLGDLRFDVPISEVALDQRGCRFVPHVLGLQVHQTLKIKNSDPTYHNVHFTPKNNPDWNRMLANDAPHIEHSFAYAEVMLPVKDNQHPWMKAYIGVLPHPFYAVTNSEGLFEIRGIPPGTYTLVAWHEGGGRGTEKTIKVTVK